MEDKLITMEEAAKILNMSKQSVQKLYRKGAFPVVRYSPGFIQVYESEIYKFIKSKSVIYVPKDNA
jgi:predicted DNA-binding transcriptional regulator AlpA